MRALAVTVDASLCVAGAADAGSGGNSARSLVVTRTDAPPSWNSSIVSDRCPPATEPRVHGARAATRFGGLDVVIVRARRAVAFYLFTWEHRLPTIRRLVARAG